MTGLDLSDTIAAIATGPGPALRGMIRLAGPHAWSIALAHCKPRPTRPRPGWSSAQFDLPGWGLSAPLDLALATAPRTYTRQDQAELFLPGAAPLLQTALAQLLSQGARLAEPGEFTLRAFLNGRLDLTQAEAVLGVIEARSAAQLTAALAQLAGGLTRPIAAVRGAVLDLLAHVEADLDFVDEVDVNPPERASLVSQLDQARRELTALAGSLTRRDRPSALPRVVLVGRPNVGKSRLFNALIEADRAIVSPQASTTRDYLTARCEWHGVALLLIDTAGAEVDASSIARLAQQFREAQAAQADLLLACELAGDMLAEQPNPGIDTITVATQCDRARPAADGTTALATSAVTGLGIETLRQQIAARLRARQRESDPLAHTSARCAESLRQALAALDRAAAGLAAQAGDELLASDLRQALDALGAVVGMTVTDDILDRIFTRFCIGK